jgi:hypothetical protein
VREFDLPEQISYDAESLRIQWLPANGLVRPTVPVGCAALIAFHAMQVGVHPRTLRSFVPLSDSCARVQSPLASHHNPARASLSPVGGSVAVIDWRIFCLIALGSVQYR